MRQWRAVCAVFSALAAGLALALPASPPVAAAVHPSTVSYRAPFGVTQVQTIKILGDAASQGGDGALVLTAGGKRSARLPLTADAAGVRSALEAGGFSVTDVAGVRADDHRSARYTITFAVDPGALLTATDNQTWASWVGTSGWVESDCVYCMDISPPTGTPNGAAIIFVHAGGLVDGTKDEPGIEDYRSRASALGYVTATANHRLGALRGAVGRCDFDSVPTPGTDCAEWIATADRAAADLQAAVDHLGRNAGVWGIDPARIAIAGGSAGGTVAQTAAWRTPGPGERRPGAVLSMGGAARTALLTAAAAPAMLAVYTHDPGYQAAGMDNFEKSRQALARARSVGAVVELRAYPGNGHVPSFQAPTGFGVKDTRVEAADLLAAADAFFRRTMSAAPAAPASLLLGQSRGTKLSRPLGSQQLFTRPDEVRRWIGGDYNGDGRTDLLSYGVGAAPDVLWTARADGTFADAIETTTPFVDQTKVFPAASVGDFDGNGRDDVLWWGWGQQVWRFGLQADGRPTAAAAPSPPTFAAQAIVVDLDGDGRDDIVWYGASLLPDALWYGQADGTFVDGGPIPDPGGTRAVPTVADVDGDGHEDVFWRVSGAANQLWYGEGNRSVKLTAVSGVGLATDTADAIVAADVDGDGLDELVGHGYGTRTDVLLGFAGHGDASPSRQALTAYATTAPLVVDLDGDGVDDLLFASTNAATVPLWYGNRGAGLTYTTVAIGAHTALPVTGRFDGAPGWGTALRSDLVWPVA